MTVWTAILWLFAINPVAGPLDQANELEEFGALVVGTWEAADSRHENEWGVGRRLIKSTSYFRDENGEWSIVSEGTWYWDSEVGAIRGVHLTVGMPFDRLDYTTRVEGSRVIHDLRAIGETVERFVETWTFSEDEYSWVLERPGEDGPERVMGGTYHRVR